MFEWLDNLTNNSITDNAGLPSTETLWRKCLTTLIFNMMPHGKLILMVCHIFFWIYNFFKPQNILTFNYFTIQHHYLQFITGLGCMSLFFTGCFQHLKEQINQLTICFWFPVSLIELIPNTFIPTLHFENINNLPALCLTSTCKKQ